MRKITMSRNGRVSSQNKDGKENIQNADSIKDVEDIEDLEDEDFSNIVIQSKETEKRDTKYDTISLDEIREKLETKMNVNQKKSTIKEVLINIAMAIIMIAYLVVIINGVKNIDMETLEKDLKIITFGILVIGIFILELSYKKDNIRKAINGIEVIVFGAVNLCLIYTVKLYSSSLSNAISYISVGIGVYYFIKCIVLARLNVARFRKDNNDIRDIVKK
ncbi:MAG: hypothetical protein IKD76_06620 [Clostridia bacterium]|nr:hypothetical protein [Clostridia bacterium]